MRPLLVLPVGRSVKANALDERDTAGSGSGRTATQDVELLAGLYDTLRHHYGREAFVSTTAQTAAPEIAVDPRRSCKVPRAFAVVQ